MIDQIEGDFSPNGRPVVNWIRDWMNHGTMIPELSGLVTESISRPIPLSLLRITLSLMIGLGQLNRDNIWVQWPIYRAVIIRRLL
jgi:hypothetical protein